MVEGKSIVFVVDDDEPVRDAIGLLLDTVDINYESFDSAQSFLAGYGGHRTGSHGHAIHAAGVELDDAAAPSGAAAPGDLLALDEALTKLAEVDPQAAELVLGGVGVGDRLVDVLEGDQALELVLVVRIDLHHATFPIEFKCALGAFEVVAGEDLFGRLVHGIVHFLEVYARRDVERFGLGHEGPGSR